MNDEQMIWEAYKSPITNDKIRDNYVSGLDDKQKRLIQKAIQSSDILKGIVKVKSPAMGLNELSRVLETIGYGFDGDTNLPDITRSETDHHSINYRITKLNPNKQDPFIPDEVVGGDTHIHFVYTKMFRPEHTFDYDRPDRTYEILAYLT